MFRVVAFGNKREDKGSCPRPWVTQELCGPKQTSFEMTTVCRYPGTGFVAENPRVCYKGCAPRVFSGGHFQGAVRFITISVSLVKSGMS